MACAQYIVKRIQTNPPRRCCVVRGSTPVICFGDLNAAKVATLGLNPSSIEFLDAANRLWDGAERRLATLKSLGVRSLSTALRRHAEQVYEECRLYFQRRPYTAWFGRLEHMLKAAGASYFDGTACHLDLVQWATSPKWSGLSRRIRKRLLEEGIPFLVEQLRRASIHCVLLNGKGVIEHVQMALDVKFEEHQPIVLYGRLPTRLFSGRLPGGAKVVGWSTNLQSSRGVTTERRRLLARRIAQLAAN